MRINWSFVGAAAILMVLLIGLLVTVGAYEAQQAAAKNHARTTTQNGQLLAQNETLIETQAADRARSDARWDWLLRQNLEVIDLNGALIDFMQLHGIYPPQELIDRHNASKKSHEERKAEERREEKAKEKADEASKDGGDDPKGSDGSGSDDSGGSDSPGKSGDNKGSDGNSGKGNDDKPDKDKKDKK